MSFYWKRGESHIDFLDFFAGIGLFRLGFEQAGWTCRGHCEIDKYANQSYFAIHDVKEGEWFEEDITKISPGQLPNVALWTAGFPCQDVSQSGFRRGLSGERSGLFFEIIRLLEGIDPEHRPRWLALENVKGLYNSSDSRDITTVLCELAALGYDIEWFLCNSKDFNVPQNRERIYFICDSTGRSTGKIFPLGNENKAAIKQIVGGSQGSRVYNPDGLATTLTSGSGGMGGKTGLYLVNIDNDKGVILREESNCIDASYYKGLVGNQRRTGVFQSDLPDSVVEQLARRTAKPRAVITPDRLKKRQNGRRVKEEDEEMFTLTATDIHGIIQNSRIRRLAPIECWRLQGVPDEYFYKAQATGLSDVQLYKQAGNAVTVNVVYEIAKRIREVMEEEQAQSADSSTSD